MRPSTPRSSSVAGGTAGTHTRSRFFYRIKYPVDKAIRLRPRAEALAVQHSSTSSYFCSVRFRACAVQTNHCAPSGRSAYGLQHDEPDGLKKTAPCPRRAGVRQIATSGGPVKASTAFRRAILYHHQPLRPSILFLPPSASVQFPLAPTPASTSLLITMLSVRSSAAAVVVAL